MDTKYQPIIGMEIHIELRTESKMFCSCPAYHFGKKPNTQTCPVCLGFPGALPMPNEKAIMWTQILGASLGCELSIFSRFDRKHYFYPDLPKGYQISQYEYPLAGNGKWKMVNGKSVRIRRIHLEEDTGKLIHTIVDGKKVSLVDFNRSGVPLLELVTEPDFVSAKEAKEFVQALQQIVRYLEISNADMEKGSMRLEANISLRENPKSEILKDSNALRAKLPDYRVEVKNINSFRFLEQAVNYEIERQSRILSGGGKLQQETRGYDEASGSTFLQRTKEQEQDYRYFPEPDILPFSFTTDDLNKIKMDVPELPESKRQRFETKYKLSGEYSRILTETRNLADYFEEAVKVGQEYQMPAKKIADTIINKKPDMEKILPAKLIDILKIEINKPALPDYELRGIVSQSIKENPKAVEDYKKGKEESVQFLIGQVMRKTKGAASPDKTLEILKEILEENKQNIS